VIPEFDICFPDCIFVLPWPIEKNIGIACKKKQICVYNIDNTDMGKTSCLFSKLVIRLSDT